VAREEDREDGRVEGGVPELTGASA
jgi:hypothetical protein